MRVENIRADLEDSWPDRRAEPHQCRRRIEPHGGERRLEHTRGKTAPTCVSGCDDAAPAVGEQHWNAVRRQHHADSVSLARDGGVGPRGPAVLAGGQAIEIAHCVAMYLLEPGRVIRKPAPELGASGRAIRAKTRETERGSGFAVACGRKRLHTSGRGPHGNHPVETGRSEARLQGGAHRCAAKRPRSDSRSAAKSAGTGDSQRMGRCVVG